MDKETQQEFGKVNKEFGLIKQEFGLIKKEFSQVKNRLDYVEFDLKELRTEMRDGFAWIAGKIDAILTKFDALAQGHKTHEQELAAMFLRQERQENRIQRLESFHA